MPALSAVNAKGIELDLVEFLLEKLIQTGKVKVLDFAEFNPTYDIDNRGAKTVARLLLVCGDVFVKACFAIEIGVCS